MANNYPLMMNFPCTFPLLNPLVEQLAMRLSTQACKSLVIPQAGEEANEPLRDFHIYHA